MHNILLFSALVVFASARPLPQLLPQAPKLPPTLQGVTSGVGVDPASLPLRARHHILESRVIRNADFQSAPAPAAAPASESAKTPAPAPETDVKAERTSATKPAAPESTPSPATSPDASKHDEAGKVARDVILARGFPKLPFLDLFGPDPAPPATKRQLPGPLAGALGMLAPPQPPPESDEEEARNPKAAIKSSTKGSFDRMPSEDEMLGGNPTGLERRPEPKDTKPAAAAAPVERRPENAKGAAAAAPVERRPDGKTKVTDPAAAVERRPVNGKGVDAPAPASPAERHADEVNSFDVATPIPNALERQPNDAVVSGDEGNSKRDLGNGVPFLGMITKTLGMEKEKTDPKEFDASQLPAGTERFVPPTNGDKNAAFPNARQQDGQGLTERGIPVVGGLLGPAAGMLATAGGAGGKKPEHLHVPFDDEDQVEQEAEEEGVKAGKERPSPFDMSKLPPGSEKLVGLNPQSSTKGKRMDIGDIPTPLPGSGTLAKGMPLMATFKDFGSKLGMRRA